jgi:hypothetical protein
VSRLVQLLANASGNLSPSTDQSGAVSLEKVDPTVKIHAVSRQTEMADKKCEQAMQGRPTLSEDAHHRHLCDLLGEVRAPSRRWLYQ